MNENEVLRLLRERDERGLEELLRHYGPLMRYIIAPILPDEHEREDCLSEVTIRVWERIRQFDPERGSLKAWLTAITRNAAISCAGRAKQHASLDDMPDGTPSPLPTPEEALLRAEKQAALRRALSQLDGNEQLLFYRKYYYRQSTQQIASELGMTERAVEGRLYRIKQRLRKALGGDGYER